VKITLSSLGRGELGDFVASTFTNQMSFTGRSSSEWVQIELVGYSVAVETYTMAHRAASAKAQGKAFPKYFMRNWSLWGTSDKKEWSPLSVHVNDETLCESRPFAGFTVSNGYSGCHSTFMIRMDPPGNSEGTNALVLACFELYGYLYMTGQPIIDVTTHRVAVTSTPTSDVHQVSCAASVACTSATPTSQSISQARVGFAPGPDAVGPDAVRAYKLRTHGGVQQQGKHPRWLGYALGAIRNDHKKEKGDEDDDDDDDEHNKSCLRGDNEIDLTDGDSANDMIDEIDLTGDDEIDLKDTDADAISGEIGSSMVDDCIDVESDSCSTHSLGINVNPHQPVYMHPKSNIALNPHSHITHGNSEPKAHDIPDPTCNSNLGSAPDFATDHSPDLIPSPASGLTSCLDPTITLSPIAVVRSSSFPKCSIPDADRCRLPPAANVPGAAVRTLGTTIDRTATAAIPGSTALLKTTADADRTITTTMTATGDAATDTTAATDAKAATDIPADIATPHSPAVLGTSTMSSSITLPCSASTCTTAEIAQIQKPFKSVTITTPSTTDPSAEVNAAATADATAISNLPSRHCNDDALPGPDLVSPAVTLPNQDGLPTESFAGGLPVNDLRCQPLTDPLHHSTMPPDTVEVEPAGRGLPWPWRASKRSDILQRALIARLQAYEDQGWG